MTDSPNDSANDSATATIDLAHTPDFRLGRLEVRPARRQLAHDDGQSEVLEPRVMQVLLALARAQGGIVTRDELAQSCWDGRIVGDDAINRVISRLRRTAGGIGAGSFSVETITKVGYRLRTGGSQGEDAAPGVAADASGAAAQMSSRRGLLVGGALGAAALAAGGMGAWIWLGREAAGPPSAVAEQTLRAALQSILQDSREGQLQAIGLTQHLVAQYPDYADGWGGLAFAYACAAHWRPPAEAEALRARAASAVAKALSLAPDNAYAEAAAAIILPSRGEWLTVEKALRRALAQHPQQDELTFMLGNALNYVGRASEGAGLLEQVRQRAASPSPGLYFREIAVMWAANRPEDTDRLMDEAAQVYPSQFAIWFTRLYILMYSGRATTALGMIDDAATRPSGIPLDEFAQVRLVIQALIGRAPADIDAAMTVWAARARLGAGYAENTIQFAAALGRIDQAFAVAEAYYFSTGFVVPDVRFTVEQGSYTTMSERETGFLFTPSTAPLRADPRFASLVDRLGLSRYWRESGSTPDYRRAG